MDLTPDSRIDEERVRADIGAALIQAGYASDEEDLLEWHYCFERRECPGQHGEPCACAGVPFVSEKVWASLRPVLDRIGDPRYRAGREDAAREALREYADSYHYLDGGHGPISTPAGWIDPDAWCACGAAWSDDEGGCSERIQLLEAISLGRSVGRDGDNPSGQP